MRLLPACLVLLVALTGCSLFQSESTRQIRQYERYVQKSRKDQAKRSAAIRRAQTEQIPPPSEVGPATVTVSTGSVAQ